MYIATIKTKYNTIRLEVEDTNSPEFQEILEQKYIEEVKIEKKIDVLKQERDELLRHFVGMSYNTQRALELTKQIRRESE